MTTEEPNKPEQAVPTRSIISRPWLVRIVVILTVLLGYGLWSLNDAYVAYPARGEDFASYSEWVYLGKAMDADRSESPGVLRREASVADPVDELARLKTEETHLRNSVDAQGNGGRHRRAQMEQAREIWLTALSRISRLHPAYTNFYSNPDPESFDRIAELESAGSVSLTPAQKTELEVLSTAAVRLNPRERFNELNTRWTSESQPSQLQSYDIPVNKVSAIACFLFSFYLIYLFVKVATKTYRWDPAVHRLTLPNGASIEPGDLDDVDKRKWDKFIVFLKIKDQHEKLGGAEVRFDTYRHGYIEDWILDMEKVAFPDRAEAEKASQDTGAETESEPGETVEAS